MTRPADDLKTSLFAALDQGESVAEFLARHPRWNPLQVAELLEKAGIPLARNPGGRFNYLFGLVSIVMGMGISHILKCYAEVLSAGRTVSLLAFIWSLQVLALHVVIWWFYYRWLNRPNRFWTFPKLIFILASPVLLQIMSYLLLPEKGTYNARLFFLLMAIMPLLEILDTRLKGPHNYVTVGGKIYLLQLVGTSLYMLLGILPNPHWRLFHGCLSLFMFTGFCLMKVKNWERAVPEEYGGFS